MVARRDATERFPGRPWLLLGCIGLIFGFASVPLQWLAPAMIIDDALYYPRVAAHLVAGHGLTYDMQTITNGLHPLWGVLLIPAAWLSGGDHLLLLRVAMWLCAGFAAVAAVSVHVIGRRLGWRPLGTGVAVAALVIPRADLWLGLLESALSLGLLATLLACAIRYDWLTTRSRVHLVAFGALVAATFLARLDFVFVLAALGAATLWRRWRAGHRPAWICADLGVVAGVAVLPVVPYLVANRRFFGSIVPVSGQLKHAGLASFDAFARAALFPVEAVAARLNLPVAVVVVGGLVVVTAAVVTLRRRPVLVAGRPRLDQGGVIAALLAGTALRWLYLRLFMTAEAGYTPWYWVPEYLCAALVLGWTAAHLQVRFQGWSRRRHADSCWRRSWSWAWAPLSSTATARQTERETSQPSTTRCGPARTCQPTSSSRCSIRAGSATSPSATPSPSTA